MFLEDLISQITGKARQATSNLAPPQPRTRQEIAASPFKMFEDNSFQGDPSAFRAQNPNYTFYEDNTFAVGPRTREQIQRSPFTMFEDGTFQGQPPAVGFPNTRFYEDNTFSIRQSPYQPNPSIPVLDRRKFL